VRPSDMEEAARLENELLAYSRGVRPLPGIGTRVRRTAFLEQVMESIRRVRFIQVLRERDICRDRADPNSILFDPLKAAALQEREGSREEAFWLVFLYVHFGKHGRAGWRYARQVYGRLGDGLRWDWLSVSRDVPGFRAWLDNNQAALMIGRPRGFGNHRKRESLGGFSDNGTGAVVASYVAWIGPPRTHQELVGEIIQSVDGDAARAFDAMYTSMEAVRRFGRLAKFDYLTMLGKLQLAPIVPGIPYLKESTGPLDGARLLFGTNDNASNLDRRLVELDTRLQVGMQVLEDSLCNWQKSPERFKAFRG
jgi:hypothetical protein